MRIEERQRLFLVVEPGRRAGLPRWGIAFAGAIAEPADNQQRIAAAPLEAEAGRALCQSPGTNRSKPGRHAVAAGFRGRAILRASRKSIRWPRRSSRRHCRPPGRYTLGELQINGLGTTADLVARLRPLKPGDAL